MHDKTDAEIARREHDAEMGVESGADRRWSRWHDAVVARLIALGITDSTIGLDGCEYATSRTPDDGFSLDYASEAFDDGYTVERYVERVIARRKELGL